MIRRRRPTIRFNLLRNRGRFCDSKIPALANLFRITWIGVLAVLAFDLNITTTMTMAQELTLTANDDVCGCSASTYIFVLDFGLSCPPTNISLGSGVASVSCLISPFGAPTTKLAPIVLDSVSILELDQNNNVLVEDRRNGGLVNGDSFSYSSIVNTRDVTSIQNIPSVLQLNLSGRNEDGVMLMNVFVIRFSNECGVTPVIQEGENAGWAIFSQMSGPIPRLCPTLAPSSTPSDAPTRNPTQQPTRRPTQSPTQMPTNNPTSQPTRLPTYYPTQRPTYSLTKKPTGNPTSPPTRLPTDEPTQRPTEPLTKEPTGKPTSQPTRLPTDEPTQRPTEPLTTQKPTDEPTGPNTSSALPSGAPTISAFPTSLSSVPSIFENGMSMSMSMSMDLSTSFDLNSFDLENSQLLEAEAELIKEFLSD